VLHQSTPQLIVAGTSINAQNEGFRAAALIIEADRGTPTPRKEPDSENTAVLLATGAVSSMTDRDGSAVRNHYPKMRDHVNSRTFEKGR